MPNILWLASDTNGVGTYRVGLPASVLTQHGFESSFMLHPQARRATPEKELQGIDTLVIQRPSEMEFRRWIKVARVLNIPTVIDVDDLLLSIPSHNPAHVYYNKKNVRRLMVECFDAVDKILVSTRFLREEMMERTKRPESDFIICPNFIHSEIWGEHLQEVKKRKSDKPTIGWQGSGTHDVDFHQVLPALVQLKKEFDFTLVLFGGIPSTIRHYLAGKEYLWKPFVPFAEYPATLVSLNFDIGIAPLADTRFNRSKSNIKWLEYSAMKVPCVASKVDTYESITHGETGYLVTKDEWYDTLKTLLTDADLRKKIGETASEVAWSKFGPSSIESWVNALASPVYNVARG
jgi:glycosyltransferase involved in cell wall biosynthesis